MNKNEVIACLDHVPIFDKLTKIEKEEIALIARHENYLKSDLLYSAGESLNALYVVHAGSVKILKYTSDGREQILRVLKHGDFFGEIALFGNEEVGSFAEVLEDAVICKIEQLPFLNIIYKTPSIASKMLFELSLRIEKLEEILTFNNLKNADAKLAKYLIDEANNNIVIFKTNKKTISSILGITPETFSRKLKEFETLGYIKIYTNKKIEIKNILKLEMLID